ncbi:unnamed protein product [Adineta ricciae]|uniref:Uncharacterized protein n=1 Tax=Adineta ricciae TaxID=249248 RepID=A0A815T5G1_ADIRI|nr:unnamed protein product [Adineta ricciae]
MENLHPEKQEFTKNYQIRRKSLQPIDRHRDEIDSQQRIYLNAGIDSTCGIKKIGRDKFASHENLSS